MTDQEKTFLITGGGGYLGSTLVPMLLTAGYAVKVLDRWFWGKAVLKPYLENTQLTLIETDTRTYPAGHLKGVDVVIDLASLSNDPIAELNPQITLDINYHARVKTAKLAKAAGVKKYILASSCSVYGFREGVLDESSKPAPVTTYARASLMAENETLSLADKNFSVTVLRQGTLYGLSPRMRFDLVLNTMVLSLFKNKLITVDGGEQWRPILSVADAAAGFIQAAEADSSKVNGEILNLGSSAQNYQIKKLAELIISAIAEPDSKIITQEIQSDFRSYQVSFEKIKRAIGYQTNHSPEVSAQEIYLALKNKTVSDAIQTKTIDWYKHLLAQDPKILDPK